MPQWAGSCWYFLRYIDPDNDALPVAEELERYWMPVDLYVGGAEHAVLHLLYARFWHKVLYDAGIVSTPEPFVRLVHQGMILGELEYARFQDEAGDAVSAEFVRGGRDTRSGEAVTRTPVSERDVIKQDDRFVLRANPAIQVDSRAHKMSKSRGNVVNPDKILQHCGADAFRLYEMFMGPLEQVKPWNTRGVEGTHPIPQPGLAPADAVRRRPQPERYRRRLPTHGGAVARAAPNHRQGHRGYRGVEVQYRHRGADGIHQHREQVGNAAAASWH